MPSDDVNLILGGFQSAAQGLQPFAQEQMQERANSKPLSPYEKWLGKVMSGELSPQQAATNAKLELQGHSIPEQPVQPPPSLAAQSPQGQPGFGYSPGIGTQQPRPTMSLGGSQPQPASQPLPQPQPQGLGAVEPQTRGDFNSMVGVAPLIKSKRAGGSPEDLAFKYWQEGQRNSRYSSGIDSREGMAQAERDRKVQQDEQVLTYKREALQQHLQETLLKLQNRLQAAMHTSGSNEKIALLKAVINDANGAERNAAAIIQSDSYLTKDQAAQEQVYNARTRTYNMRQQATELLNGMKKSTGQSTSVSGSTTATQPAHTPESLNALFGK